MKRAAWHAKERLDAALASRGESRCPANGSLDERRECRIGKQRRNAALASKREGNAAWRADLGRARAELSKRDVTSVRVDMKREGERDELTVLLYMKTREAGNLTIKRFNDQ